MAIRYRINILNTLKAKGYNTTRLRNEKIFGQATIQDFRTGKIVSLNNLCKLCDIFHCDIGDIIHYVPDESAGSLSSYASSLSAFDQTPRTSMPTRTASTATDPDSAQEDGTDNADDSDDDTTNDDADSDDSPAPAARGITPDDLARLNAMFNNFKKH